MWLIFHIKLVIFMSTKLLFWILNQFERSEDRLRISEHPGYIEHLNKSYHLFKRRFPGHPSTPSGFDLGQSPKYGPKWGIEMRVF